MAARSRPRYPKGHAKAGLFMSNRAIAARKAARSKKRSSKKTSSKKSTAKKKTTGRKSTSTAIATKKKTPKKSPRKSGGGGAMNSPNSFWPAVKSAVPVVIGAGAGMVAPAALTRLALKEKDQGLMGYGANAAVSVGGWFLLKKSAKTRKFALPWLVGGMIQLGGRVIREQAPQVAQQLGLGVNALPTPYAGGAMAGVGAVRIETQNGGLGVLRVVNG